MARIINSGQKILEFWLNEYIGYMLYHHIQVPSFVCLC